HRREEALCSHRGAIAVDLERGSCRASRVRDRQSQGVSKIRPDQLLGSTSYPKGQALHLHRREVPYGLQIDSSYRHLIHFHLDNQHTPAPSENNPSSCPTSRRP